MKAMLVFPNQLYVKPSKNTKLFLLEDWHFFNRDLPFHKHKLILHRASMKAYFEALTEPKSYYDYGFDLNHLREELLTYEKIYAHDPVDLEIKKYYQSFNIEWLESQNFITDEPTIKSFFSTKNRYLMHDFYVFQRKRLNILMLNGEPLNGRYSFDQENRKKLPKDMLIPKPLTFSNKYITEATNYVNKLFKDNPGNSDLFNYPVTKDEAKQQLHYFMAHKFKHFGPYQDAFSNEDPYLFHSNLSSSLNIGLLSPKEIIDEALKQNVPIESKEGFIRQIIGWREFIRALYILEGAQMKQSNSLNQTRKLSSSWYQAKTDIDIVDQTIQKLLDFSYTHHIERLMVLGNIMLLLNIDPKEVYNYFMALHIDAYDWVMVPNIYGMSQFATPIMTTKPYFSGSNYLKKMGVKDGEWANKWDALFYMFLEEHRDIIEKNPRLGVLIKNLDKKDQDTLNHYQSIKKSLLKKLTLNEV